MSARHDRRAILGGGLAAASLAPLALAQAASSRALARPQAEGAAKSRPAPFRLAYAPHPGMFGHSAGDDLLDQIRFMADQGFTALEHNGLPREEPARQEAIGRLLDELGMRMGVFVANGNGFAGPTFAAGRAEDREQFVRDMRAAVETAVRVGARWCTVVPGLVEPRLEPGYQAANVIDTLRAGAEICEPAGLVMVLEPLNGWRDHPGMFLTHAPQAFMICRAVDSPSCKILFDVYHQQITEGNLIPNIDRCWSEIAYFQVGDHPGRKEPGTGEIHYRNLFRHLHAKGYEGIVGMEHGNSLPGIEGERALIDAYREHDAF